MSDYPSAPYAGNMPFLPPAYPDQYMQRDAQQDQGTMNSHYGNLMSAYGYNNAIPASAVASGVPPLPIFQGWNQDPVPLPPYTTQQNGANYGGYTNNAHTQYYTPPSQTPYQTSGPITNSYHQGGLDEGEFEDNTGGYGAYQGSGGTNYNEPAQHVVQPKVRDFHVQQSSYHANQDYAASRTQNPNAGHSQGNQQPDVYKAAFAPIAGRSVTESREQAQGAVLDLRPYAQYQTYLDEGFSRDIVDRLFDDLHIGRNDSTKETMALPKSTVTAASRTMTSNGHISPKASFANEAIPPSLKPGPAPPPAVKSAAMSEKERTLQSKMEALRKSREERALKAAAKNVDKSVAVPEAEPLKQPSPSDFSAGKEAELLPSSEVILPAPAPSAPLVHTPQQSSRIPGLFLASTGVSAPTISAAPPQVSSQPAMFVPNQSNLRKRPVAADFDDVPSVAPSYKRPFGHSNGERLVIDVSEDESEDEGAAMDLESQVDQESPMQHARKMSDQRSAAIQNLSPLSNMPPHKPFTPPPNSLAVTTPPLQTTPKLSIGKLQSIESKMAELKTKIAEAEARKRANLAASGTRTPRVAESPSAPNTTIAMNLGSKIEESIELHKMVEVADSKVVLEQQRLVDAHTAEIEKAAEVKKNEAEQKRLRREKIAADMPLVDAEVQQSQSKLEQLRAEIAKIEATVQKNLEDKRQLAEEMERLGQEAEDQLQAQQEKLKDLNDQSNGIGEDFSRPSQSGPSTVNGNHTPSASLSLPIVEPRQAENPSHDASVQPSLNKGSTPASNYEESLLTPSMEDSVDAKNHDDNQDTVATDQALETALQDAVRAEADLHSHDEDDMDLDDIYAPDPNQLAPEFSSLHEESRSPPYSPGSDHVESESLQRAQSRSPPYSPEPVANVSGNASTVETASPDFPTSLNGVIPEPERESDDYEPPEATPPVTVSANRESTPVESPPFSPAPPSSSHVVEEGEMLESSTLSVLDIDKTQSIDESVRLGDVGPIPAVSNGVLQVVEDRSEDHDIPHSFTPYESPLKHFKAYRFHPAFTQDVTSGLRSKTYSHKINPMIELCRYELAGGICNDTTCDLQHFRSIGLPDDAVLTALGSPDEFKGEQRDRFCAGLKGVLMDLRVRKIRDFDIIASEIIAHRAKFLGDSSKVLAALEGTSL